MKYHSQNDEAKIILDYFNGYVGTLLDVGANDGITFSNSYDLIQRGWGGYLLEPSLAYGKLYYLYRDTPSVITMSIGLGAFTGIVPFFESNDSLLSTTNISQINTWPKNSFKDSAIPVLSFMDFYNDIKCPQFDFITIDAETEDWSILKQIDLNSVGCRCLCIEYSNNAELFRIYSQYCNVFGLREIHRNGENIIFAR